MNPELKEAPIDLSHMVEGSEAWGTELGAHVFSELNRRLIGLNEGTLVQLDYAGLHRSDVSFQREAVVETLRKHRPRLLFVAVNLLDADVTVNLEVALERRGEALLVINPTSDTRIIGRRLTPEQQAILGAVRSHSGLTSTRLTYPPFSLKPSTASNQLTAIWRAGLICRIEGAAVSGGREYRYYAIA